MLVTSVPNKIGSPHEFNKSLEKSTLVCPRDIHSSLPVTFQVLVTETVQDQHCAAWMAKLHQSPCSTHKTP